MCAANTSWSLRASTTWKGDPSPGLFPNMKILVGKPRWCYTEAGNAMLNSCNFELTFPPVPGDTCKPPKQETVFSKLREGSPTPPSLYVADDLDTLRQALLGELKSPMEALSRHQHCICGSLISFR